MHYRSVLCLLIVAFTFSYTSQSENFVNEEQTAREYIIYADESAANGRYFSNFYGGALVRSSDIDDVRKILKTV